MNISRFCSSMSQKIGYKLQKLVSLVLAAGMVIFSLPFQPVFAGYYSMLAPTDYTPSTYIPPRYDAFDHDYYRPPVYSEAEPDTPPVADFTMNTNDGNLQSPARGTTTTRFTFDASNSTDNETDLSKLEVRWDFENDGVLDSYFSRTKTIQHTYEKSGVYTVRLQVLDTSGNISETTRKVTVVNNTAPNPFFVVEPTTGTEKTIFHVDTQRSRDDQYLPDALQYRFDWNNDGAWDTKYQDKTSWNHRFDVAGTYTVVMQVKDPGGLTSLTQQVITVTQNTPPVANFSLKTVPNSFGAGYEFNASSSSDNETKKGNLLFRWDFNYNGPDDIIYDTDWGSAPQYSGYYSVPGTKTIKLEVKDEDGAISRSFAQINVGWTETMAKQYMTGLR